MLSSNIAALSVDREVRQSQQEPQHTGLGWCRGPRQRTAASTSSAVIAVFRLGADPYVRRIPDIVALTHSASLGFGSSAALQRRRIAASLRDSVEGFFPSWTWEAMKLAMASGVGSQGRNAPVFAPHGPTLFQRCDPHVLAVRVLGLTDSI